MKDMALTVAKTALYMSMTGKPHEIFPHVHPFPTSAPPALWRAAAPPTGLI